MMRRRLPLSFAVCLAVSCAACLLTIGSPPTPAAGQTAHVVVELRSPPLAEKGSSRATIDREQRRFTIALRASIPGARVYWRYRLVANGVSVVLPARQVGRLEQLPGVRRVFAPTTYHVLGGPALGTIGVRNLPGYTPANAGAGIKIGIIDDGIDQTHPFFNPSTFTMPPGFPRGQIAYTTAKVIVARSFPPPGTSYAPARLAFDKGDSIHGTHVAGIAAGDANTPGPGVRLTGVAPRAYLGNYRALTIPTDAGVGLDGNAPELVAAIEAAVADGMDVINLSLGEPEIEPANDIVAQALDAAADAGVVSTVAAGNEYGDFGSGTVTSPGSAEKAIAVAASSDAATPEIASFSSAGPAPVSLRLKPDVTAPGVGIISSVPGGWSAFSGTSMAAPHVAGAAALLLQRHPDWSPAQVKAALTETGKPTTDDGAASMPIRAGAGLIDVADADAPLVTVTPTSLSLGLLGRGEARQVSIDVADAGGGAEPWAVSVDLQTPQATATVSTPTTIVAPGVLPVDIAVGATAADADLSGVIVLTRGSTSRRIPFWGRIRTAALAGAKRTVLTRPGIYAGNTSGRPSLVTRYRYPEVLTGDAVHGVLAGPEQVFRLQVTEPIANFGIVITRRDKGVRVEPRIVVDGDENRLAGYAALPFDLNPYLVQLAEPTRSVGVIAPAPAAYDIVFDSATPKGAGRFSFRLWINDTTPPSAKLLTPTVKRGDFVSVGVADAGSGVDPATLVVKLGGKELPAALSNGVIRIPTRSVAAGRVSLRVQVSDHQETRNMENVGPILPNTRILQTRVTITRP